MRVEGEGEGSGVGVAGCWLWVCEGGWLRDLTSGVLVQEGEG